MPRNLLLALACAFALAATAQPTWRFPIAFEDGTGARDTIWMVYDTSATVGSNSFPTVDYALGEGAVSMDPNTFNVWVGNWDNDSTKTVAFPYTEFPYHNATVQAFNFQYPVTIRWDLSLGTEPWLPQTNWPINGGIIYNSYFYYNNNIGQPGYFNMSVVDSVYVEDPSPNFLFPVDFTLGHHDPTTVSPISDNAILSIYPNPAENQIHIIVEQRPISYSIYSMVGELLLSSILTAHTDVINVQNLPKGTYTLTLTTPTKNEHIKFIKAD